MSQWLDREAVAALLGAADELRREHRRRLGDSPYISLPMGVLVSLTSAVEVLWLEVERLKCEGQELAYALGEDCADIDQFEAKIRAEIERLKNSDNT